MNFITLQHFNASADAIKSSLENEVEEIETAESKAEPEETAESETALCRNS